MTAMQWIRIEQPVPNFRFNFKRKLYHMLGLLVPAFFYFDPLSLIQSDYVHLTRLVGVTLNVLLLLTFIIVDVVRFGNTDVNDAFMRVAGSLLKKEEMRRFNATVPYLTATLILYLFTQDLIAGCACTFLMLGDPAAAYIGGRFGRVRFWNSKSLEGLLGFFLIGFIAAAAFFLLHSWLIQKGFPNAVRQSALDLLGSKWQIPAAMLVVGAFSAGVTEFFSFTRLRGLLDDNVEVPLVCVASMIAVGYWMGLPTGSLFFNPSDLFLKI